MDQEKLKIKIATMLVAVGEVEPGVTHVEVRHDAGCPAIHSRCLGDCTCSPEIKLVHGETRGKR